MIFQDHALSFFSAALESFFYQPSDQLRAIILFCSTINILRLMCYVFCSWKLLEASRSSWRLPSFLHVAGAISLTSACDRLAGGLLH